MNDISIFPKDGLFKPTDNTGKSTLILGSSFSGKTTFLVNELNKLKQDDYTLIILFTESRNAEPLKKLHIPVKIIEGYDESIVNFLKKINNQTNNRFNFLVILDDVVDQKHSQTLSKMILLFRNSNISTVISIQYPMLINKSSRSSFHQSVVLGSRTMEWWKSTSDILDLRGWWKSITPIKKLSNDEIYKQLKDITNNHNAFIYINLREGKEPSIEDY